jgi:hypothetical protein
MFLLSISLSYFFFFFFFHFIKLQGHSKDLLRDCTVPWTVAPPPGYTELLPTFHIFILEEAEDTGLVKGFGSPGSGSDFLPSFRNLLNEYRVECTCLCLKTVVKQGQ